MNWLRYLLHGSNDLWMPRTWLADTDRLALYEAYTKRQHWQGRVVADTNETRRKAFWRAVAAKRQPSAVIRQFRGRA